MSRLLDAFVAGQFEAIRREQIPAGPEPRDIANPETRFPLFFA